MNISQIMNQIYAEKIETHIFLFPYTKEWKIKLVYTSPGGDKLEIQRANADFEAVLFAAFEALKRGMNQGLKTQLEAPKGESFIEVGPAEPNDEVPF